MKISIVIPTFNRSGCLNRALYRLRKVLPPATPVEIHVIDDNSDHYEQRNNKNTCEWFHVSYHRCVRQRGPAHARNIGIEVSNGSWIAFLDDDVYVDSEWFTCLCAAIEKVGSRVVGIEGVTRATGSGVWDQEVENISGGKYLTSNIAYKRDVLLLCRGFDESFTGAYAEDHELALRIKKIGTIHFQSNLTVFHMPRQIRFSGYIKHAVSRMQMVLDAEYLLFMKHPYQYRTVRAVSTFWREYRFILFRHVYTTVKRRKWITLLAHPFQTAVLCVAASIEQCAAWCLLPKFIIQQTCDVVSCKHTQSEL